MKNAARKPQLIGSGLFGPLSRYRLTTFETRFDTTEYHVEDAERVDEQTGLPAIIRQCERIEDALAGLDGIVAARAVSVDGTVQDRYMADDGSSDAFFVIDRKPCGCVLYYSHTLPARSLCAHCELCA